MATILCVNSLVNNGHHIVMLLGIMLEADMGMASPVSYSFSSVAYPIPSSFLQTLLLQLEPLQAPIIWIITQVDLYTVNNS